MRLGEDRGAARSGNAVVSRRPCPVPRLTVFGRSPKPVKIEVFAKTDLGKTRDHNEDRFLVADLTRGEASLQPAVREHEVGERGSLFIVADGMGGAAAGELASEMATETIYEQMIRMWGNEKDVTPQRFAYRLKEAVKVDLTYQEVRKGDVLVLCSDGLSGQVKKEEIAEIVTRERDLQEACDRLIALANERGGPDNVTVVLARFDGDGLRSAAAGEEVGHQVYPLIDTEVSTEPVPVYRGSRPPLPARENRWRVVAAAVLGFGPQGPAVEFRVLAVAAGVGGGGTDAHAVSAGVSPAGAGRRSSAAVRIVAEVARLRRTTKVLIGLLALAVTGFGWSQWTALRDARELAGLQARADSLNQEAQRLLSRFQSELQSVKDALRESHAEVARLRGELAAASSGGDVHSVARLRAQLDTAAARQRGIAGAAAVDYRAISRNNQDAVALLVVKYSDVEVFTGTAFAVDSQGTLVTNKHVLVGEAGDRRPLAIAVKFSGSKQWFPGRVIGVADTADVGVLQVDVRGGTPRVLGFAREASSLQRGDPVAIMGYPLGEDLPMERQGPSAVADPTLTVGTVSKVLPNVVQVDGYG